MRISARVSDLILFANKMKVTKSSRSLSNLIMLVVCLGLLSFGIFITASAYPDNGGWFIGAFLIIMLFFGSIIVSTRLIWPTELFFEIRDDQLTIIDLKRSGHGYREITFPREEVARIHYSRDSEYSHFIERISGEQTKLAGEIFEAWPAIKQMLKDKAPEIKITEQ